MLLNQETLRGITEGRVTLAFRRWKRPWARAVLRLLDRRPGVRAGDLASEVDMEKARFKVNVQKLKGLGLTESLGVGYRLSPRGAAALAHLDESARLGSGAAPRRAARRDRRPAASTCAVCRGTLSWLVLCPVPSRASLPSDRPRRPRKRDR